MQDDQRVSSPADEATNTERSAAGQEQRAHGRAKLHADVSLYSDTNFWSGYTEDVSEGGLFVASYTTHPIGTVLDVTFELPTGDAIRTRGEVRWHRDTLESGPRPGMGIRFLELSAEDLVSIRKFVKHRSPLFWDERD